MRYFTLEDVRFSLAKDHTRPVIMADNVARLSLDAVRLPRPSSLHLSLRPPSGKITGGGVKWN